MGHTCAGRARQRRNKYLILTIEFRTQSPSSTCRLRRRYLTRACRSTPGVAYIKYERASSAALAVENLHEVTLNNGVGPRLKVMLAESPTARTNPGSQSFSGAQRSMSQDMSHSRSEDPDNMPPRSRLFIVVPKNAMGAEIEARMAEFPGLQYCKTDLIASKGIVFAKYDASSSAYAAMEAVQASGSIAGYRVKVMIAEPKNQRRLAPVGSTGSIATTIHSMGSAPVTTATSLASLGISSMNGSEMNGSMNGGFHGMEGRFGDTHRMLNSGMNGMNGTNGTSKGLGNGTSFSTSEMANNLSSLSFSSSQSQPVDLDSVPPGNRLFVVVHKGVNEESLASLFRCYPSMEYLNLKRDRVTGRSKGYAYVNYLNLESATLAQAQLNGIEFPQGSGCMLKVLFAAPLTISNSTRQNESLRALSVSSGNSGADLTQRSSPAKSFLQGSHPSTAMNTPSHDTSSTNFQLPSPNMSNSGSESVGHAFGYGDFGQAVQNSARTDLSSASHDSFVSPLSSPLGKSNLSASQPTNTEMDRIEKIQQSFVDLRLDFGLFDETNDADPRGFFGSGNKTGDAALSKSLRDSIESSFGSYVPDSNSRRGDAGDGVDDEDVRGSRDLGNLKAHASTSPQREVYSIFAEPLQSEKVAEKMFGIYGNVEDIELLGNKVARIRYEDVDAAHSAMTGVNDLAGVITVSSSPPRSL